MTSLMIITYLLSSYAMFTHKNPKSRNPSPFKAFHFVEHFQWQIRVCVRFVLNAHMCSCTQLHSGTHTNSFAEDNFKLSKSLALHFVMVYADSRCKHISLPCMKCLRWRQRTAPKEEEFFPFVFCVCVCVCCDLPFHFIQERIFIFKSTLKWRQNITKHLIFPSTCSWRFLP